MKSSSVIIAILIFAVGCNSPETEHLEAKSVDLGGWILENVVPQKSVDRVFREITIEKSTEIGSSDSLILYRPGAVFGDENGFCYVVDYGDILIKKFDSGGNLVGVIGGGRGDGPGEMQNPTDLNILPGGSVAVVDPNPRKQLFFDSDGNFSHSRSLEVLSMRLAHTNGGLTYFMIHPYPQTHIFAAVRDTTISSFPSFDDNPLPTSLHLDGRIIAVDEDMLYMPYSFGLIVRYNSIGEQIYARETAGRRDLGASAVEKIELSGGRETYRISERIDYARSITTDNKYLFIHARNTADSLNYASVIDAYRADDGSYQYSFYLPHRARVSEKHGSYVYSLMDTTVVISRIQINGL